MKPDDIAAEFVKWMLASGCEASKGWPVPIDSLWKYALWFEHETDIVIEARNNFFAALGKRPEITRVRVQREFDRAIDDAKREGANCIVRERLRAL